MMSFDEFADPRRFRFCTLDSKMACAYREALAELESVSRELWKTMRMDGDLPYFLPDCETPAIAKEAAEDRLAEIQTDIEAFVNIVGGYSRDEIWEELHRCKLEIAKARRHARHVLKQALSENPNLSQEQVEVLQEVQDAFEKRDRIVAELKLIMAELEGKLRDAMEILRKYG
jgi:hypothetical protein